MLKKDVNLSKMDYARRESEPIFEQVSHLNQDTRHAQHPTPVDGTVWTRLQRRRFRA